MAGLFSASAVQIDRSKKLIWTSLKFSRPYGTRYRAVVLTQALKPVPFRQKSFSAAFAPGINPRPILKPSFSAACRAHIFVGRSTARLKRLRKRSNRERKPLPQRLKPHSLQSNYGRPQGRPLQGSLPPQVRFAGENFFRSGPRYACHWIGGLANSSGLAVLARAATREIARSSAFRGTSPFGPAKIISPVDRAAGR